MSSTLLRDRAIVSVTGEDAEALLNRLFTNSVLGMADREARYAALLSPQGKLLFDFLVYRHDVDFWIDCRRDQAADLTKKLNMFKLRAKAVVQLRDDLAVVANWGGTLLDAAGPAFRDPRHPALGHRIVAPPDRLASLEEDAGAYRAICIALGIPTGGVDWVYGETFVHDANLDLLHGVDFDKGCYVGQEVVSRVHHRSTARKRVAKVHFHGQPAAVGTDLKAGTLHIGQITSRAGHDGLAAIRIDRLQDAASTGLPVTAGDTLVEITLPMASVPSEPAFEDGGLL